MSTSSRITDVRKREENAPTHLNFGLMCVSDVFCNVEVDFFNCGFFTDDLDNFVCLVFLDC